MGEHQLLGRVGTAHSMVSYCSCGHAYYGRNVDEADRRFRQHRPDYQLCVRCCAPIEAGEPVTDRGDGPEHEDCP
jgi:hypothetical protein